MKKWVTKSWDKNLEKNNNNVTALTALPWSCVFIEHNYAQKCHFGQCNLNDEVRLELAIYAVFHPMPHSEIVCGDLTPQSNPWHWVPSKEELGLIFQSFQCDPLTPFNNRNVMSLVVFYVRWHLSRTGLRRTSSGDLAQRSEPIWFGLRNPLRPHALSDADPRQGLNLQPSAWMAYALTTTLGLPQKFDVS